MTSISKYEDYSTLHNDFSEDYQEINKYVLGLYAYPKKIIDETAPALDRFIREYSVPGTPRSHDLSTKAIFEFISQVDVFTAETVELFNEHKLHVNCCAAYMKKVVEIEQKQDTNLDAECADDYIKLVPYVLNLRNQLTRLKRKADNMIARLTKLELRWVRIKARVDQ